MRSVYAPLEGSEVAIGDLAGTFRACGACGCRTATISVQPVGVHLGHLRCTSCKAVTAWLGRDHLAALLAAHAAKGAA